jgi:hypothetical protein
MKNMTKSSIANQINIYKRYRTHGLNYGATMILLTSSPDNKEKTAWKKALD